LVRKTFFNVVLTKVRLDALMTFQKTSLALTGIRNEQLNVQSEPLRHHCISCEAELARDTLGNA
jgi:hypothetical protein